MALGGNSNQSVSISTYVRRIISKHDCLHTVGVDHIGEERVVTGTRCSNLSVCCSASPRTSARVSARQVRVLCTHTLP
eukprot:jgi/Chrzof1/13693/Cz08g08120.t1